MGTLKEVRNSFSTFVPVFTLTSYSTSHFTISFDMGLHVTSYTDGNVFEKYSLLIRLHFDRGTYHYRRIFVGIQGIDQPISPSVIKRV
jgi:hypothetical protein